MKIKQVIFLVSYVICLLTFISQTNGQTTITIGTGTLSNGNTQYPAPYGNYYWGAKHQILIRASELTAAGASAGNITSLAFDVKVAKSVALNGFTIKIKPTTATSLTATLDTVGFTTVWGPQTYTETTGWNTHTFTSSFSWNGTSNVLIQICFNNTTYTNNAESYYSTTSYNSTAYAVDDASGVCNYNFATLNTKRTNMKLGVLSNIPPVVNFDAIPTYSCDGIIAFKDSSAYNPTSWYWNFGDGESDSVQNPTHLYTSNGSYSVTLIATNTYGSDTLIKNNFITIDTSVNITAVSCTTQTTGYCCGYGIYNVAFGTINNSSGDAANGYEKFICQGASFTEGKSYTITVQTGPNEPENVRAWIDFNNDGIINNTTELIFSSNNNFNHTGTVIIPLNAVLDTALRMRVLSEEIGTNPGPCATLVSGQSEDYVVIITPNTDPPAANFSADDVSSCDGIINFADLSSNGPNSWLWTFGDGKTDTVKTPTHIYDTTGTYTVKLVVTNAFGADSITKTNYIKVVSTLGGPNPPSCSPITINSSYGLGIFNVTLNTINNTTDTGSYMDYSCTNQTTLTAGNSYVLSVKTNPIYEESVRAWIDYNNNSIFDTASELVFSSINKMQYHSGNIIISGASVLNTPLRLRIGSDYGGVAAPSPCKNSEYGQFEDYGVSILTNTTPPIVNFGSNKILTCTGVINFTDSSLNVPTSWVWNFGDGTSDTLQNPSHTYTASGTYSVTLIVSNTFGSDTLTKTNFINVTLGNVPINPSCTPTTNNPDVTYGIFNVTFNTINNSTSSGDGYKDYTCGQSTNVTEGASYTISIQTSSIDQENVRVWIDYNNNGVFANSELVFSSNNVLTNHSGNITISSSGIKNTALRMRVGSDVTWMTPSPCADAWQGQFEDYTVTILPNTNPPVAKFGANKLITCSVISFSDSSSLVPTSWLWDFGDGQTSTLQNPTHTYASTGYFTVKLKVCNAYGCDSLTKSNYVQVLGGDEPINASCTPTTNNPNNDYGIFNVTFNTINKSSAGGTDKYQSYVCEARTTVIVNVTYPISITTGSLAQENVRVWIDYNNNGVFANSELVFSSNNVLTNHSGNVTIPNTAIQNTALRMRVAADVSWNTPSPCTNVYYGQFEDYTVTIYPNNIPPIADFTYLILDDCQGIVKFTDVSAINPTSWVWDFGDGLGTSVSQNPYYIFKTAGNYMVKLTVTNPYGSDFISKSITINTLKTDFTMSPVNNTTVSFTDITSGAISWNWDFGDGYSATIKNPVHDFVIEKTYTVKLTTTNASSCIASITKVISLPLIGIDNIAENEQLSIYPNPASGEIWIDYAFKSIKDLDIEINNILGETIYRDKKINVTAYKRLISLKEFNSGVYFIKINDGTKQIIRKVVIQ